jgi:hypothetical protein
VALAIGAPVASLITPLNVPLTFCAAMAMDNPTSKNSENVKELIVFMILTESQ